MQPITVDGRLRPDLDMRDVPCSVMAAYLGVTPQTVIKWAKGGEVPYVKHGSLRYFQPWRIWAAKVTA